MYSVSLQGGALMFFAASSLQPLRLGAWTGSSFFLGTNSVSVTGGYRVDGFLFEGTRWRLVAGLLRVRVSEERLGFVQVFGAEVAVGHAVLGHGELLEERFGHLAGVADGSRACPVVVVRLEEVFEVVVDDGLSELVLLHELLFREVWEGVAELEFEGVFHLVEQRLVFFRYAFVVLLEVEGSGWLSVVRLVCSGLDQSRRVSLLLREDGAQVRLGLLGPLGGLECSEWVSVWLFVRLERSHGLGFVEGWACLGRLRLEDPSGAESGVHRSLLRLVQAVVHEADLSVQRVVSLLGLGRGADSLRACDSGERPGGLSAACSLGLQGSLARVLVRGLHRRLAAEKYQTDKSRPKT